MKDLLKRIKHKRVLYSLDQILNLCYIPNHSRENLILYYYNSNGRGYDYCLFYINYRGLHVYRDLFIKCGMDKSIKLLELECIIREKFKL